MIKPIEAGCLAWAGQKCFLVEVMRPAPISEFILPNGVRATGERGDVWVIRSLCGPLPGARGNGLYGHVHRSILRPISGDPDAITETDKEKDHAYTC